MATLYLAAFTSASTATWARADIANGRNGFSATGYVSSGTNASAPTTGSGADASVGVTVSGLSAGTAYKLWLIWDDGANSSTLISSAEFRTSYVLSAESGTFSYTGGTAGLAFNRALAAAGGTFAYTGGDASFVFTRKLAADSGTFSYTGGDATLVFSRKLVADGGTFSYTGGDATLTYTPVGSYTLPADSGTFSYSGGDATFAWTRAYTLTAESGTFSLSGGDADLTYSGAPVVETTARRGGAWKGTGWQKARQRIALQTWWDYLTEETPAESTQRIIKEVKAGRPIPQTKTPKGPESISAEKLADKIIPSRLWAAQNIISEHVELQRVVAKAIRIAQERDDEDVLMLL
jgi:hypothetical protein